MTFGDPAVIVVTGVMAAGRSTVAPAPEAVAGHGLVTSSGVSRWQIQPDAPPVIE
jgi:dephospho-CoA kinase